MKHLFIWVLLFALGAAKAQQIEIKDGKFTFENIEYAVQDDSEMNGYRFISAWHKRYNETERFLFISDSKYDVFTMYAYKEQRWYDFDPDRAEKYLRESKNWKNHGRKTVQTH